MAAKDNVVPRAASDPVGALIGRPDRREEMVMEGSHVTFATGGSALKHTLPRLVEWLAAHSDARPEAKGSDAHETSRVN